MNSGIEFIKAGFIIQNVIGLLQALLSIDLGGHDRTNCIGITAIPL